MVSLTHGSQLREIKSATVKVRWVLFNYELQGSGNIVSDWTHCCADLIALP